MAYQSPSIAFQPFDNALRKQNLQGREYNALVIEGMERKLGDAERLDNSKWLQTIAKDGIERMQQNPEKIVEFMREVEQDGQRSG